VFIECRLTFWDTVKAKYKVDMSALKPFAVKCLTDRVHVQPVDGEHVMSRPAEICSYSLTAVQLSELLHIRVNHVFHLSTIYMYMTKSFVLMTGFCVQKSRQLCNA